MLNINCSSSVPRLTFFIEPANTSPPWLALCLVSDGIICWSYDCLRFFSLNRLFLVVLSTLSVPRTSNITGSMIFYLVVRTYKKSWKKFIEGTWIPNSEIILELVLSLIWVYWFGVWGLGLGIYILLYIWNICLSIH